MKARFVISSTGMAHDRLHHNGIWFRTFCGQTVSRDWTEVYADNKTQLITSTRPTKFCSNCFNRTYKLKQLQDECNINVVEICEWNQ